ncbi:hypothetical protein [Paenibacillus sp. V4I9]
MANVNGASTTDGAQIIEWSDNNTNNQMWQLSKVN